MLVPKDNLLSNVDGVYNAICVTGNGVGDVIFYGQGAGKLPTASAVVGDIIDALKHQQRVLALSWDDSDDNSDFMTSYKESQTAMYIRIKCDDADNFKRSLSNVFGQVIFIERENRPDNELAFITQTMTEKDIDTELTILSHSAEILSKIRIM